MKKLVSLLLVSVFCVAGMFAVDFGAFPKGTWQDSKWDADWVFGVGSLQLVDSNSGDVIFDFEGKMKNFKLLPSTDGVSISFDCPETQRSYKFTKPATLDTSIEMEIDPEWTDEDYKVKMSFKK